MLSKGVIDMNKFRTLIMTVAVSAVVVTGCTYPNGEPNNTGTGALVGGGIGAATGAVLGGRNAGAGALIGGVFGVILGSIIGNQQDQAQAAELRAQAPVTYVHIQQGNPLTVADVEALISAKVSDDVIMAQIQNSHTVYHLNSAQIIELHNNGASDRLVDFMINTVNMPAPAPTVVATTSDPPPPPSQPVIVAPGPGYVWMNGEWQWNGAAWVWVGGQWAIPPWPNAVWVQGYWYRGPFGGWRHAPGHWR
jgi:hypothetical protein